ncbi:MAG: inositol monophosphatase family protein [Isosphaeraceae bacterium]
MDTSGQGQGVQEAGAYRAELEFVVGLLHEAAAQALARARGIAPMEKSNLSYVTAIDHDLERMFRDRLAEKFPDDSLTGEEYDEAGGSGPRRWSIDPIDGTGNMVHGLPLWAISVGLIDAGEPVLGAIIVPPLNELYTAVKGCGAWRAGERLHALDADEFHNQDNVCIGTNALRTLDPRTLPGRLRDLGSACCELVFVSSNRLQAAAFLGEGRHDVAAGAVIAAEAGCGFATVDGRILTAAEFVGETPVKVPTFVAPPRRLKAIVAQARRFA